jgi:hypothetical protein
MDTETGVFLWPKTFYKNKYIYGHPPHLCKPGLTSKIVNRALVTTQALG